MKAFIDASVILAALGSKSGGSSEVLKLLKQREHAGVVSQAVIEEVFRNAHKIKITENEVHNLIIKSSLEIVQAPASGDVEKYSNVFSKDAHVIASAVKSKSAVIITLDKRHLLSQKIKGLKMLTPGEFLKDLKVK